MVRTFTGKDIEILRELQKKHYDFDFPDLTHAKLIAIAESDGEIVGGGILREIPEVSLILDKDKSLRAKCVALGQLMDYGLKFARNIRHEGVYGFVHEDDYEQILIKHFGFREAVGKLLFKEVDDG